MLKIDVPEMNMPRVVIVGGGFGGLELVKGLKNKEVQIVLIDRNNYHTFQPLLYQVATAGLEPDSIAFPIRKIFKHYPNFYFRLAELESVDPEAKTITTNIGSLSYDYLVIATGSVTNFFGNERIQLNSMPLKSVVQALDMRSLMLQNFEKAILSPDVRTRESRMNFVIVGGGPTGVELAGALGELKSHVLPNDYPELDVRRMQIHLIEAGPRLLSALSEESSRKAFQYLKNLGVHIWLNTHVTDYDGTVVKTNAEKELLAKNLVWSAGVKGNAPQGLSPDIITLGNRVLVDEFNEIRGLEDVYAVGDVAAMLSDKYTRGHPMVAPVAMQQGRLLAKNLVNKIHKKPMKPFVYNDQGSMATIGRNKAVVEIARYKSQGAFAWFIWMYVHLISLVGFRNRLVVLINWLWNYVNYDRGIRLIIRPFNRIKNRVVSNVEGREEAAALVMDDSVN
jgi:NADH dehydrogenase